MRNLLLIVFAGLVTYSSTAQTKVAIFDTLYLSQADTAYVNFFDPGQDVGFDEAGIHFPCVYDTTFGINFWDHGFTYSNKTDSVTSGYGNQYSAKAAGGYLGSSKYAVVYGSVNYLHYEPTGIPKTISGFYITNNTYAYNSMRDGDGFSKKFGGATGVDDDWFRLTVKGIKNGQVQTDSVDFYLADFRDQNSANDYIVKDWQWVDLTSIGDVDTIMFRLQSTDTGTFGMNTPAYFCMDNFTTIYANSVDDAPSSITAKVYPNPASEVLYIETTVEDISTASLFDLTGKLLQQFEINNRKYAIPTSGLTPGTYLLRLSSGTKKATIRFIKQ